jgi:hypothetical protein
MFGIVAPFAFASFRQISTPILSEIKNLADLYAASK